MHPWYEVLLWASHPSLGIERRAEWFHVTPLPGGAELPIRLSALLGLCLLPLLTASYLSTHFPRYAHCFPKLVSVFFPMEGVSWDLSLHLRDWDPLRAVATRRVTDLVRKISRFRVGRFFLFTTSGALRTRVSLLGAVWEHREVMPKTHSCICRDRRSAELLWSSVCLYTRCRQASAQPSRLKS